MLIRYKIFIYLFGLMVTVFVFGCSEPEEDISAPPEITFHDPGILNKQSPDWHGDLIRQNDWNMRDCQRCHAADFSGGTADASCLRCHTSPEGPLACNTCHGDFSDASRIAPPKDIDDNTSPSARGVGAHVQHLYDNTLSARVRCSTCHNFPSEYNSPGHVDTDLPAEVELKRLATANGAASATYNPADASCSDTYCHGNFTFHRDSTEARNQFVYTADVMTGNILSVIWTDADGETECGSCHGLPPEGHIQVELKDCAGCHPDVVDPNGSIIDKTKHINGEINVWGE